jgi:hypothetical protein
MIPAVDHFAVAGALIDKATKGVLDLHLAGFDQGEPCRCSRKEREALVRLAIGIGFDYLLHCTELHLTPRRRLPAVLGFLLIRA